MGSSEQIFTDFTRLSFNSFLLEPSHNDNQLLSNHPSLIILNTWLNASPKHIQKYVSNYRTIYPQSPILLTTSNWRDWTFRSKTSLNNAISPVISYIISLTTSSKAQPKILLHMFSNGGATTAVRIAYQYKQQTKGKPLPISKMILDSTPGKGNYFRTITAFAIALPSWRKNPVYRFFGLFLLHVVFSA